MWLITKNILDYLCNENIPREKRIKIINKNKDRIIAEITKLTPEDLLKLLFNNNVLEELKLIICEEINNLSKEFNEESKEIIKSLINAFKNLNNYQEEYLLFNTCPDVLKKEIIKYIYPNASQNISSSNLSQSIKKTIIKLSLDSSERVVLLEGNLEPSLKEFIIDECVDNYYMIYAILDNSDISDELKLRLINTKINNKNLYNILCNVSTNSIEYILREKSKEFENYLNGLTPKELLKTINSSYAPESVIDHILKYRQDAIIKAVDKASSMDITKTVLLEQNAKLLDIVYERRAKTIYRIISSAYNFQLMDFLKLEYLPHEYKDYILNKRKRTLNSSINKMKDYLCVQYIGRNSFVPKVIQEQILEVRKEDILLYFSKMDEDELLFYLNSKDLNLSVKKMLIVDKINTSNIFKLLDSYLIEQEIIDLVIELKKDVLKQIFSTYKNNELFKAIYCERKNEVIEQLIIACDDLLQNRVNELEENELNDYLKDSKVITNVKELILERLGVEKENISNVLVLTSLCDIKLVLANYQNVINLICRLDIDFNSFLQYGSGSKKYSKWLEKIIEVIFNNDINAFAQCKDYLFNNYYVNETENNVYLISSFLEYIDNYSKYKELFINLVTNNVKLTKEDKDNLKFLFNLTSIKKEDCPQTINELKKLKLKLYKNYINCLNDSQFNLKSLKELFNDILFCKANDILLNIGGTGSLRTLKKDNIDSPTIVELVDELMLYSSIIEMVNYTNNEEGIRNVLIYIFSDIDLLTKIQNIFSNFEDKVRKLYELDSMNNLTTIDDARKLNMLDIELSKLYGGEVFNFSDKNYCLYGHVLSRRENIEDLLDGVSRGNSNFISVSPISYRGQKYYYNRKDFIFAYDTLPVGSFICSSINNMGTNGAVSSNSSEVNEINRAQRGILETSAVIKRNAEALLYREGLKPCGLILPGGRNPSKKEMELHERTGLPFIITQEIEKAIDSPNYMFTNNLNLDIVSPNLEELKHIIELLKPSIRCIKEDDIYTGKEIGIFTDCHSMYEPTVAILEDMRRRGIAEIYSLGDNVGLGPNPAEVFDLLDEFQVQSVAGNAEYYNTIGVKSFPYLTENRLDSQLWTERKLGPTRIKKMKVYPSSINLLLGNKSVALCHFANDVRWDFKERSVYTYVNQQKRNTEQLRYTNSEDAIKKITNMINKNSSDSINGYIAASEEPLFDGKLVTDYDYILQGHYHFELEDTLDETKVCTLRAVCMGYEENESENEACYYIVKERKDGNIEIEKIYVSFNQNALLSSIHNCDLPSKDKVLHYIQKNK